MNVIISNQNKDKLDGIGVDIIKSMNGEFEVDEIVNTFSNFFFNKMFLDITAINDYHNLSNLQKLSMNLDVDKIIILLNDDSVVNSNSYLSGLVSMGIYNFGNNLDDILYLYNNPNSYKDVAHYQSVNNEINVDNISNVNSNNYSSYVDDVRIIGIKNVTNHAGATSLIYMFKKCLSKFYSIVAIEVNKKDFIFYNDNKMFSVSSKELGNEIKKHSDVNIILIDLNDIEFAASENICDDVLYLVEPSLIKINKLVMLNRDYFKKISGGKIILNKSFFNEKDVKDFSMEAGIKVYYNLPNINDRNSNEDILLPLFAKLGLFTES